jgi:hypothetical protein
MCINFNAFGLVLHRFMWSRAPITFSRSPSAYHELTALRHVTCGWTLFQELIWACSPHMNGSFRDYRSDIRLCLPQAQELIASFFLRIQELSHEIELSRDCSGMQHELLHHFVQILGKNTDAGLTRGVILPCILQIKQLRRLPTHPTAPLPFTYHDVMLLLRDAEITHYVASRNASSFVNPVLEGTGMHDPVAAAAQLRPSKSPYGTNAQGRHSSHRPLGRSDSTPIRCELCLDRFGFSSHDAPWCPFLHPDNIRDREINQRVLQYKVTHSIKQDPVPDKLKQALKDMPNPQKARLPKPIARFAEADPMPSDEDSASDEDIAEDVDATIIDSAQYDYPLPPMVNSALVTNTEPGHEVNCPFEYRALQE